MAEKLPNIKLDFRLLSKVIALTKPYRVLFLGTILVAIIVAPLSMLRPHLISIMVDDYILKSDLNGLYYMVGMFIIVTLVTILFRYLLMYYSALVGQNVIKDMRIKVFNHITNLNMRYFDRTPIGKSTTRTINDIETINTIFTQGIITMAADILGIVAVIVLMFYNSWKLTLLILLTVPLLVICTYIFKEKVKVSYQRVRQEVANMNAFMQERISGMRIIQIFNAEKKERAKFKYINHRYTRANLDAVNYYAVFYPAVEFINYIALALLIWIGTKFVMKDEVTLGVIIAFPWYINLLFRPIRMLADKFNTLQMGLIAAERVFDILDLHQTIENKGKIKEWSGEGKIEFDNVQFSYDGINKILKNVQFAVQPNQTLAIVGSTGSGKTTIINALSRFYEIEGGIIKFDNTDIRDFDLQSLRKSMAIVLQNVFLFHGTVYENITMMQANVPLKKVIEASKLIGAHPYIARLPNGYHHQIQERGNNLSMGQRQLISFVRALIIDPKILVLDEATSSIDSETEQVIQYAIEELIKKRTSIIIAHRFSTIKHADNILVMHQGEVVEFGHHDELMLISNGRYRELYEMQFSNQEVVY